MSGLSWVLSFALITQQIAFRDLLYYIGPTLLTNNAWGEHPSESDEVFKFCAPLATFVP
jgi:hypothetical protein